MQNQVVLRKSKKEYDFCAHGLKLSQYFAMKHIPLWVKVQEYILGWYLDPRHKNSVFYCGYKKICRDLKACGCDCTVRGIEEAFRILKSPVEEGGVETIKVIYCDVTKTEWTLSGLNPRKYIYRKVYLNWKNIYKYYSVLSLEGQSYQALKPKSRLKKLIKARYRTFTRNKQEIFNKAMQEAKIEKYTSFNNLFYGFLYSVSSLYYDVKKLIRNFIPKHAIDLQKEADKEQWITIVSPYLNGSPLDPSRMEPKEQPKEAPISFYKFIESI